MERSDKDDILAAIANVAAKVDRVEIEQRRQTESTAELRGQLTIALQWLQSMDQRFGALMAPINPPRKAG